MNAVGPLDSLLRKLRERGPVVLLESQSSDHPEGRVSYLAGDPEVILRAPAGENRVEIVSPERPDAITERAGNPWKICRELYAEDPSWWFGFLGYDLKNYLEVLDSGNRDPVGAPDLWFIKPGTLLEYRHADRSITVLAGDEHEIGVNRRSEDQNDDNLRKEGKNAGDGGQGQKRNAGEGMPGKEEKTNELNVTDFGPSVTRSEYLERIKEAQYRIREGDFYEINLSHQMNGHFEGDPFELYRRMRDVGPVPFAAYLEMGGGGRADLKVCSLSPERFLARSGNRVFSQPIKGTIERGATPELDAQFRQSLMNSPKDRAENLMIVDLVRNDLSRIARRDSVSVRDLFQIQTFGTVHQMVSTVEARPASDDPFEIIEACYPMGSMTGAPKISAMKSIEELEDYRRGVYSGAIGYLDPRGNFDFNVVIRTALIRRDRLYYSVGGAITSDSDPESEWKETLVKGRALTLLFG